MSNPAEKIDSGSRRRLWPTVLYICLLGAGVFAAREAHLYWRGGGRLSSPGPTRLDSTMRAEDGPAAVSGPKQLAAEPLGAVGLRPLAADPGGIKPPAGARRRTGFRRYSGDCVQSHARYDCASEVSAAAEHYKQTLTAAGFELLREERADKTILLFIKDQTQVYVVLRKDRRDAKMVTIVLTVTRPASRQADEALEEYDYGGAAGTRHTK